MGTEEVVLMKGIVKMYPGGVVANRGVDFDLRRGEIHALLGENGAGKTTLMKILAGCLRPDEGEIYVKGRKVDIRSPRDAMNLGIGMVHQHFTLIPNLTVAENIILGMSNLPHLLNLEEAKERIRELSESVGLKVDPEAKIDQLSAGEKQRVEILRLLYRNADVLIFDEPTSILAVPEVEALFETLRSMVEQGKSVVFVTHKMWEALSISDRITVMRKGRVVARVKPEEVDDKELVALVVGERVAPTRVKRAKPKETAEEILRVENLRVEGDRGGLAVKGVSFTVHEGEIFGIAGIEGNGQKELVEAITGLRPVKSGRILFIGQDITGRRVSELIEMGMAYIPEERIERGVAADLPVVDNSALKRFWVNPFSERGIIKGEVLRKFCSKIVETFKVKCPGIDIPVRYLSGGNIQRLIVGRELSMNARLVVAENPTAGLDVKSTNFVREMLIKLRDGGAAILLVSTDLDEILELSDVIGVMYDGRMVAIRPAGQMTAQEIGTYMLGGEVVGR
ncbi:MAG: ABC transporter ATP-binding protein [Candidatus Korarchaeota archaeon]|nr:ABC transporter ATP-binding protein [Candidatus Korarchaeota archaeon]